MAVGQQVLRGTLDVPALLAVEERLEQRAVDAGRVHAATLRDVLNLHSQYVASGMPLSTEPQLALLLRCSEWRAGRLLNEALLLATLPQALEALEWGILTPEQSSTVVAQLAPLSPPAQLRVWERLLARLHQTGLPPARLAELLRRWVIEADAEAAEARRKAAEDDRRVEYRRRDDGLGDLFAFGFRGPDLQAILSRINDLAAPFGPYDQRTADQRRFDALKDLLLGRAQLGAGAGASCGCRAGEAAPCGVDVQVHVPLGGALGITDEVADLASHGPVEPDLLQDLLLNSPRLTPVFVDELGVPVAMGRSVPPHERGNTAALRAALLDLATQRPPDVLHPRHPLDHRERPPDTADPPPAAARTADPPPADPPADARTGGALRRRILTERPAADERLLAAAALATGAGREHPSGQPGRYRVSRSLRRLLFARAPRCEFPGCGAKAVRCDAEHDVAWPAGPTCACNLGPCCRRHHRVKQEGWTKTRITDAGVRWTSPSGRTWSSPPQHEAPARPVRALPPLTASETPSISSAPPSSRKSSGGWRAAPTTRRGSSCGRRTSSRRRPTGYASGSCSETPGGRWTCRTPTAGWTSASQPAETAKHARALPPPPPSSAHGRTRHRFRAGVPGGAAGRADVAAADPLHAAHRAPRRPCDRRRHRGGRRAVRRRGGGQRGLSRAARAGATGAGTARGGGAARPRGAHAAVGRPRPRRSRGTGGAADAPASVPDGSGATASNPSTIASWAAIFAAASVATEAGAVPLVAGVALGSATWVTLLAVAIAAVRRRVPEQGLRLADAVAGVGLLGFGAVLGYRAVATTEG